MDKFEARYGAPLLPATAESLAAIRLRRGQAGAAPAQAWALGGAVILPDRTLGHGWVVINGNTIASVGEEKPATVLTLETGGVILPGLIDRGARRRGCTESTGAASPTARQGCVAVLARSSSSWRSSIRRIFPVSVFGSSATNSTRRGYA